MTTAAEEPGSGRRFYAIVPHDYGAVDVYLFPQGTSGEGHGALLVRDIDPEDADYGGDLEGHIRAHYCAWCASGETITI